MSELFGVRTYLKHKYKTQLPRFKIYIGLKPSLQKYPIGAQFITSNILLYIMKKALHEKRRASFVNYYNYLTAKGLSGSA
jgi:hypothetical protein